MPLDLSPLPLEGKKAPRWRCGKGDEEIDIPKKSPNKHCGKTISIPPISPPSGLACLLIIYHDLGHLSKQIRWMFVTWRTNLPPHAHCLRTREPCWARVAWGSYAVISFIIAIIYNLSKNAHTKTKNSQNRSCNFRYGRLSTVFTPKEWNLSSSATPAGEVWHNSCVIR